MLRVLCFVWEIQAVKIIDKKKLGADPKTMETMRNEIENMVRLFSCSCHF
jgi:hypothetical protein